MNDDILKGKWKQVKGEVRNWWGDLTDDEVDQIEGNREKLEGLLQERYGRTKEEARDEVENFLDDVKNRPMYEETR